MPLIRSVQILSDRVVIETPRGTRTFLYSQVSQSVLNQGAAAIEAFCVSWLEDPARDIAVSPTGRNFYVAIHVLTLTPALTLTAYISNAPVGLREWWLG